MKREKLSLNELLERLKNKELFTLSYRKPFTILSVHTNGIEVKISTGSIRFIRIEELQWALTHLERRKSITRKEIEMENYSPRNSAYVFAVLAEMPQVSYNRLADKLKLKEK